METPQSPANEDAASLNVQDLVLVVRLIDICSKRGAFEGKELSDVGSLRNRIAAFVEAHGMPAAPVEQEQAKKPLPDESVPTESAPTDTATA
jgi:hypothetical protein